MREQDLDSINLPPIADLHVHLRDGIMMDTVVPSIRAGGADTVFVMPNLTPPITTVAHALSYHAKLQAIAPDATFLMSLYLHPTITPATIAEAKAAGITGVKSYPAGVTTNSDSGVVDYEQFYPVFEAMQEHDMVLNLHGEVPPSPTSNNDITVINAEELFLPTLVSLHKRFPHLRIILEHCTSAAALDAVRSCGPTVAATITAHHLYITIDDAVSDPFCFCKPVAKTPEDRRALLRAVVAGEGRFFFGSDSAPHPVVGKRQGKKTAAGCFTQGWCAQLVVGAVQDAMKEGVLSEKDVSMEALKGFLCDYGRKFYKLPEAAKTVGIVMKRAGEKIPDMIKSKDGSIEVIPFRRGENVLSLSWA